MRINDSIFLGAIVPELDNGALVIQQNKRILFLSLLSRLIEVVVRGVSPLALPDAIADSLEYLKAFGGTEQRNLPANYIQRDFIYMMDGSYLLTDIVPTYDGHYELDMQTTNIAGSPATYLGCLQGAGTEQGLRFAHITNGAVRVVGFGSVADSASGATTANTRYKFVWNNNVATVTTGGTTVISNVFSINHSTTVPLAINALNTGGEISGNIEGIYLYGFKAWNAQGELVADYVPAIQKGTVPVVGFYDTVSGTFKTATAGTFAAGSETQPTPDAPMNIVCNNGVLKVDTYGLPSGYTKLEYIESTGTQYIDTGIVPTLGFKVKTKIAFSDTTGNNGILGEDWVANSPLLIGMGNGTLRWHLATGSGIDVPSTPATAINTEFSIEAANGYIKINDTLYTGTPLSSFSTTNHMRLFYIDRYYTNIKMYSITIWDNDIKLFNGIPAKRNSDNAIGIYDTVSKTFFTNAGAGTFTTGPELPTIYTDGSKETLKSHGKNLFDGQWRQGTIDNPTINNRICSANYIPVLPNTTYTFHSTNSDTQWRISFYNTSKERISSISGKVTITTAANTYYIKFFIAANYTLATAPNVQIEQGSIATTYEPYFDGGTATAEMLLKVGNYEDVQEILSGAVTRNVGVKVFDGTENWVRGTAIYTQGLDLGAYNGEYTAICSHFQGVSNSQQGSGLANTNKMCIGNDAHSAEYKDNIYIYGTTTDFPDVTTWTNWLRAQYAAGTPVIVVYPLATPTTESVAGQTMQVQQGDNIVEITQAAIDGLELEAKYQAAVTLTIQEVQDANLDPNVEVTIN